MKKSIIFAVCALFMGLTANAQFTNTTATTTKTAKNAGTMGSYDNWSRFYVAYDPMTIDLDKDFFGKDMEFKSAFSVGYSYAFNVVNNLPVYVEAGLAFNLGSFKDTEKDSGEEYGVSYSTESTDKITQMSLLIPVNLMYKWDATDAISVVPYLGLRGRYILSMKEKYEVKVTVDGETETESKTTNMYDEEEGLGEYLKHFMLGYQVGVQGHFNNFYVGLEYNSHFGNLIKDIEDTEVKSTVSGWNISIGILF